MARTPDPLFLNLVDRHGTLLLRAARLLCGDWSRAEDLLQRALARALSGWDPAAGERVAFLRLRQELVATYLDDRPHDGPAGDPPSHPARRGAPPLLAGLGELPPALRASVVAHRYLGLDTAATAQVLDMTPNDVADADTRCVRWLSRRTDPALSGAH